MKLNHSIVQVMAKNGQPTLKVNDVYLHSTYDPGREAERLAANHFKPGHFHVLIGFGLGYLAQSLFEKVAVKDYLLIIEPNPQVFHCALDQQDFSALIESSQVGFVVGEELAGLDYYFALAVSHYQTQPIFIESPNYTQLYPNLFAKIKQILMDALQVERLNANTGLYFAGDWQRNYLHNLYPAVAAQPFLALVNKLRCPVMVVAAGPSLSKQIPLLQTVQNRALILCAGTAIIPLLAAGIRPHAIVCVDGGEANYRLFKDLAIGDIPLIYTPIVHHGIVAEHRGPQVVFNHLPPDSALVSWTERFLGKKLGYLFGGASVATFCFAIAAQMTSGPICFVGQDLAYTGNQSHAANHQSSRSISSAELDNDGRHFKVQGYFGDEVVTDKLLFSMKKTLEKYLLHLRQNGDYRPVINATEGGAMIEGMQNMPLQEFLANDCQEDYSPQLKELFLQPDPNSIDWDHYDRLLYQEQKKLRQIKELCSKAIKKIKGIKVERETIDASIITQLDKTDKKLQALLENNLMYFVLQPALLRVRHSFPEQPQETPAERCRRILNKSRALYEDIYRVTIYTEECLQEVLAK